MQWPGQIVIAGCQTHWTKEVSEALEKGQLKELYVNLKMQVRKEGDGMGWDRMEWDGTGRAGMGWDGLEQDGKRRDGKRRDEKRRDGMGRDGMGRDGTGWEETGCDGIDGIGRVFYNFL